MSQNIERNKETEYVLCVPLTFLGARVEPSSSANRLVGILERIECRIFASSSCRARRDLMALEPRARSEVFSRAGEGRVVTPVEVEEVSAGPMTLRKSAALGSRRRIRKSQLNNRLSLIHI